jgi:spore germination protein GerM
MKAMIAQDCMLQYPNHNKPFHSYIDASNYQLGAVIVQEGVPVAYYSRKLTDTQKKYTTLEKELLSIFMTCKEFETMLLGPDISIHVDNRKILLSLLP